MRKHPVHAVKAEKNSEANQYGKKILGDSWAIYRKITIIQEVYFQLSLNSQMQLSNGEKQWQLQVVHAANSRVFKGNSFLFMGILSIRVKGLDWIMIQFPSQRLVCPLKLQGFGPVPQEKWELYPSLIQGCCFRCLEPSSSHFQQVASSLHLQD